MDKKLTIHWAFLMLLAVFGFHSCNSMDEEANTVQSGVNLFKDGSLSYDVNTVPSIMDSDSAQVVVVGWDTQWSHEDLETFRKMQAINDRINHII